MEQRKLFDSNVSDLEMQNVFVGPNQNPPEFALNR